jgi:hypothetical protein
MKENSIVGNVIFQGKKSFPSIRLTSHSKCMNKIFGEAMDEMRWIMGETTTSIKLLQRIFKRSILLYLEQIFIILRMKIASMQMKSLIVNRVIF